MTVLLRPPAKGLAIARCAIAMCMANKGDKLLAAEIARERWGEGAVAEILQKAAVGGGTLISGSWSDDLARQAGVEFLEAVRNATIIGRLQGLRRQPLRLRVVSETTKPTSQWVGSGKPKPVTKFISEETTLEPLKVAAISVITDELARHSDPAAEELVRRLLVDSLAETFDASFLDPSNSGVVNIEPASITNGVSAIASTGDPEEDLKDIINSFAGDLTRAYFVAQPETLVAFSSAANQDIGVRGGSLKGAPALASKGAPADTLILLDPGLIAMGEGGTDVRVSRQGTVEMLDSSLVQDGTVGTGTSLVSAFQNNLVLVLAEQTLNWHAADGAVAMVEGITSSGVA